MSILPLTLGQRVLDAGVWSYSGHVSSQDNAFGGNLLMTRLPLPEMVGVKALVGLG